MAISEKKVIEFLGWVCAELPELHQLECPKLLEAWQKFLTIKRPVTPWGSWQERGKLAESVKAGDRWIQIKSGRVAVVQGPIDRGCVPLQHENGNKTRKWKSYFGAEFTPEQPPV